MQQVIRIRDRQGRGAFHFHKSMYKSLSLRTLMGRTLPR
jgi:hypothetical protein